MTLRLTPIAAAILTTSLLTTPSRVLAERADRDQPVNIEANRITVDEAKKLQIFEGNVQLSQGSMVLRAERMVVSQDANGYQKGIAYAGKDRPASFRQKREGKNEYIEGEAERIEHDGKAEKTELFSKARIRSGLDEVHGQYIAYDAKSENYVVSGNSPDSSAGPAGSPGRVRAIIQPKNKSAEKPAASPQ
jgi:lipopolysaccharide export system protein LptA